MRGNVSVVALAVLTTGFEEPAGALSEEGWKTVSTPGLPGEPFKTLKDGALVHLGVPFAYPDAELYARAVAWLKPGSKRPRRVWVFPDTLVPELETAAEVTRATAPGGRWVSRGKGQPSFLEQFGFSAAEATSWLREAMSGDPARVQDAKKLLEQRLAGREADIEAVVKSFLEKHSR